MRNFIKKITHPFLKIGLHLYYSKPRKYCYNNLCVKVHPEVFPPHLTLSTKLLLDFINDLELKNKKFLELGCGSGIISLLAAKKKAHVFASDINEKALEYIVLNATNNNLSVQPIFSNLFEKIDPIYFDYIVINPPYYPKKPKNIKEKAWFCGENFEYFTALFSQLKNHLRESNQVLMILSEDCETHKIKKIASENKIQLTLVAEKKVIGEKNYIFRLVSL
jgi:release factor glutamine methyltransferase